MAITKHATALAAVLVLAAFAAPAGGQSGPGGPNPDKRLAAWEKQLVLPQKISARLSWAQRRLRPSGNRKLEKMGRALAPAIAGGGDFKQLWDQACRDTAAAFPGLSKADVSGAVSIIMAAATAGIDDDLRLMIEEMKSVNEAKQKMRGMIAELNGWISQEMSKRPNTGDIGNDKASGAAAGSSRLSKKAPVPPIRRMSFETKTSPVIRFEYVKAPAIPPLPPRNPGLTVSGLKSLLDDIQGNLDGLNEMSEAISLRLQSIMDRRAKIIQTLSNIIKKVSQTSETLVQNIK